MNIMRKIGLVLLNILFICLHLIGLWFIEALFFGKLISMSKGMGWSLWLDILIYIVSFLILWLHYLAIYIGQRRKLISQASVVVLAVFEVFLAAAVFLLFMSDVIYISFAEAIFYFVIQLIILIARYMYIRLCSSRNV